MKITYLNWDIKLCTPIKVKRRSAAKAAVIIPKTRKIPYALRSNPIGHKRVLLR